MSTLKASYSTFRSQYTDMKIKYNLFPQVYERRQRHTGRIASRNESRDKNTAAASQGAPRIASKLPETRKRQVGFSLKSFKKSMTLLTS